MQRSTIAIDSSQMSYQYCLIVFSYILLSRGSYSEGAPLGHSPESCETVYLLHVVPYPDSDELAGWDRGLETIPAGQLAIRHINNRTDLLGDLKLELVNIPSEACERSVVFDSYAALYQQILNSSCIGGLVGLYCSIVTDTLVPPVSHDKYGYVQLTSATSPLLLNKVKFPYLFRSVATTAVFNKAMIAMMTNFNWSRVISIHDSVAFYFKSTANDFAKMIDGDDTKELLSTVPISPTEEFFPEAFRSLREAGSRVSYHAVTVEESRNIMCGAFKERLLWPGYVYVFLERTIQELTTLVSCTPHEMMEAVEGVFILKYRLQPTEDSTMVSGMPYSEYQWQYQAELRQLSDETGMNLQENEYGNSLYDQIWAYALAMNNSLDNISLPNGSFESTYKLTPGVRETLANQLRRLVFQGVTGLINFGEAQEVQTFVDVYQVRNGSAQLIGVFDSYDKNITFTSNFSFQNVPSDTFDTQRYLVPLWLGLFVITAQILLLFLVTANLVFIIWMRKKPEIKSSSVRVSVFVQIGCYFLCLSPVVFTILSSFPIGNTEFTLFCNLDQWLTILGFTIVFVSLFFRLLRIFHIFRSFRSTGKYWSDKYLLSYISMVCLISVLLLGAWTVFDIL